jgi:hypothetical protein
MQGEIHKMVRPVGTVVPYMTTEAVSQVCIGPPSTAASRNAMADVIPIAPFLRSRTPAQGPGWSGGAPEGEAA